MVVLPCLVRYRDPTPTEGAGIYPACQNLLLAARALGYGGVMTTWHQLVEDELRPLLGIPDGVAIAATIPLGRPGGQPRPGPPPAARRARVRRPLGRRRRRGPSTPRAPASPAPAHPADDVCVELRPPCGRELDTDVGSSGQRARAARTFGSLTPPLAPTDWAKVLTRSSSSIVRTSPVASRAATRRYSRSSAGSRRCGDGRGRARCGPSAHGARGRAGSAPRRGAGRSRRRRSTRGGAGGRGGRGRRAPSRRGRG